MDILLICDRPPAVAATLHHHIDSLAEHSAHRIHILPIFGTLPAALDLNRFDAIVLHWSLVVSDPAYIRPEARARIAAFPGVKAVFIQDEYRFVNRTITAFRELGIDVLFTCVPESEIEKVYPEARLPGVLKVNTLTGYVDLALTKRVVSAPADRPIDVGYRARRLPPWLGELGQEKSRIAERFKADAADYGLRTDISCREEDRIYGEAWVQFMASCKAILGVESGASVFDFDGNIQAAVEADLANEPTLDFETLRERHFKAEDGRIRLNQISPRCFEAAALRTVMILYEGEYSGRLQAGRHYVALRKDHANMDEVVSLLRDPVRLAEIADRAYREVALNPVNHIGHFVREFDQALERSLERTSHRALKPYEATEFARAAAPSFATRRRLLQRRVIHAAYRLVFGVLLARAHPEIREYVRRSLRHLANDLRRLKAIFAG